MRTTISFLLFLFWSMGSFSQELAAYIDYSRFKLDDSTSYVEFYIGVDAQSATYVEISPGKYRAEVYASIQLKDGDKIRFFEKFNIQSPIVSEVPLGTGTRFNFAKRVATKSALLDCRIELKDMHSEDSAYTASFQLDNRFKAKELDFSDIQLLNDFKITDKKQGDFVRSGYQLTPYISNFYPDDKQLLKYYVEIYNTDELFEEDEQFVVFTTFRTSGGDLLKEPGKFKRHSPQEVIGTLSQIDISKLPSGSFYFIVEVRNRENELIAFTKKEVQRVNTKYQPADIPSQDMYASNFTHNIAANQLPYYLQNLSPIASDMEKSTIESLINNRDSTQMREYFFDFWYSRYKNDARKEWVMYLKRIEQADAEFNCFGRPGYLTEQGRVYLKYGPPNRVETEFTDPGRNASQMQKEYQVWMYYELGGQRNIIFVFVRPNAGQCEYELIHSNAIGEIQNQDWSNNNDWREVLRNNRSNSPVRSSPEGYQQRDPLSTDF